MITKIISFFKNLSFKDWLLLIISIMFIITYFSYKHIQNENRNIINTDSLTTYKNKIDSLYKAKTTYIMTIDELKKYNTDLYKEVKNLKDNPIIVTKVKTEFKIDTLSIYDTITKLDSTKYNVHWYYKDDKFIAIDGNTSIITDPLSSSTKINNLSINADLTIDVIENKKDKQLQIIAKTDNKYLNINNIEGAVLDPTNSKMISNYYKPKRFGLGIFAGYGLSANNNVKTGIIIGVGLSYNFIQF